MSLLQSAGFLLLLSFHSSAHHSLSNRIGQPYSPDTMIVAHNLDGQINDWPANSFASNDETGMAYAIANDQTALYLVLNIPDPGTQFRIMRRGLKLFIDPKSKKKEGRGIEFPLETENESTEGLNPGEGKAGMYQNSPADATTRADQMKKMRMTMALNMVYLRYFGFGNNEPKLQDRKVPGGISTAFAWDSSNVMHIEYSIPFSFLGEVPGTAEKPMSIGWKINPAPARNRPEPVRSEEGGYRRGGRGGAKKGVGYGHPVSSPDDRPRAQSFWVEYTLQ